MAEATAIAAVDAARPPQPPSPLVSASSPYPFAAAPDIIRAHQKDAYFAGLLTNQLADLHRRVAGARAPHAWAAETRTAAGLLYLALTTLLGHRTLGEEYCGLVQVEDSSAAAAAGGPRLPTLARRAAYIATSILLPYTAGRVLPSLRRRLRNILAARLASLQRRARIHQQQQPQQQQQQRDAGSTEPVLKTPAAAATETRALRYLLTHLGALTSGAHVRAAALAVFYFTGAYYSLAARAAGLRYVFTRRVPVGEGTERQGYEVLGVLLGAQLVAQAWLHVRAEAWGSESGGVDADADADADADGQWERAQEEQAFHGVGVDVSLDENAYSSNNELLLPPTSSGSGSGGRGGAAKSQAALGALTHTPLAKGGRDGATRFDLRDGAVMAWMRGQQQRRCTLCLEELRDPSAPPCGHVFCWTCLGDWLREKAECPLCRREALVQHVLPLRVA